MAKGHEPWPKAIDKLGREVIDREAIKALYLAGDKYSWDDFCEAHNFPNGASFRQNTGFNTWQREWIARQVTLNDDQLIPELVKLKREVTANRITFARQYSVVASYMRTIGAHLAYKHAQQAVADQRDKTNTLSLSVQDFRILATSLKTVAELESMALLMPSVTMKEVIPLRDAEQDQMDNDAEESELRSMPFALMDGRTLDHDSIKGIMSQWIDQVKDEKAQAAEITYQSQPLDSLDDDEET